MTTQEVSTLTGATLRQLQFWHEQGVVEPTISQETGNRYYDPATVRRAAIATELRRKGITRLDQVARILRQIGTRHGVAVIVPHPGGMFALASNHYNAAMLAEKAVGPVIIVSIQPLEVQNGTRLE